MLVLLFSLQWKWMGTEAVKLKHIQKLKINIEGVLWVCDCFSVRNRLKFNCYPHKKSISTYSNSYVRDTRKPASKMTSVEGSMAQIFTQRTNKSSSRQYVSFSLSWSLSALHHVCPAWPLTSGIPHTLRLLACFEEQHWLMHVHQH